MNWRTLNHLQLALYVRHLTERLEDSAVAEDGVLHDSVKADLDAVTAEQARRQRVDKLAA